MPRDPAPEAPAFDWATLQHEAETWAYTLEIGTDHPVVAFGQIYATGSGGVCDEWVSLPLDLPTPLAVELMRWLAERAKAAQAEGGNHA